MYSVAVPKSEGRSECGTVLVDPGSDTNYIRHDFARVLGLTGTPYDCYLKVVNMEYIHKRTARYLVNIEDRWGTLHVVEALGLDSITTLPEEPDLATLAPLLEGVPRGSPQPTPGTS